MKFEILGFMTFWFATIHYFLWKAQKYILEKHNTLRMANLIINDANM